MARTPRNYPKSIIDKFALYHYVTITLNKEVTHEKGTVFTGWLIELSTDIPSLVGKGYYILLMNDGACIWFRRSHIKQIQNTYNGYVIPKTDEDVLARAMR